MSFQPGFAGWWLRATEPATPTYCYFATLFDGALAFEDPDTGKPARVSDHSWIQGCLPAEASS